MAPIGTRTLIVSLESGALPACPFPAGTLIIWVAVYLFLHCAHFIALSMSFHYKIFRPLHWRSVNLLLKGLKNRDGINPDTDPVGSGVKIGSGSGTDPGQFLPDPLRYLYKYKIKLIVVK